MKVFSEPNIIKCYSKIKLHPPITSTKINAKEWICFVVHHVSLRGALSIHCQVAWISLIPLRHHYTSNIVNATSTYFKCLFVSHILCQHKWVRLHKIDPFMHPSVWICVIVMIALWRASLILAHLFVEPLQDKCPLGIFQDQTYLLASSQISFSASHSLLSTSVVVVVVVVRACHQSLPFIMPSPLICVQFVPVKSQLYWFAMVNNRFIYLFIY